jgi:hypothetical protein
MLIPDTVLPVYSGDRAIRSSEAVASRRGARGTRWSEGGQYALVTRPRRRTGMSRRTPIDWLHRVSGARRPRVQSGLSALSQRARDRFVDHRQRILCNKR